MPEGIWKTLRSLSAVQSLNHEPRGVSQPCLGLSCQHKREAWGFLGERPPRSEFLLWASWAQATAPYDPLGARGTALQSMLIPA